MNAAGVARDFPFGLFRLLRLSRSWFYIRQETHRNRHERR